MSSNLLQGLTQALASALLFAVLVAAVYLPAAYLLATYTPAPENLHLLIMAGLVHACVAALAAEFAATHALKRAAAIDPELAQIERGTCLAAFVILLVGLALATGSPMTSYQLDLAGIAGAIAGTRIARN